MIEYSVFPGGKKRVVTFSYDDGPVQDERLVAMFNRYGVKGTFHLNGQTYIGMTDEQIEKVRFAAEHGVLIGSGSDAGAYQVYHAQAAYDERQYLDFLSDEALGKSLKYTKEHFVR